LQLQYGCRKIFQFVHEVLTALAPHDATLALKLFLEAARAADRCEAAPFKLIAYEFVTQAFLLYEDELTDSKTQIRALASMVGTLIQTRRFEESDYDALATKTTQYAAKLLKKPDQCRMVAMASHLFYVAKEVRACVGVGVFSSFLSVYLINHFHPPHLNTLT
jgi:vacuolar protein sorting-associated protein 35